METMSGLRIRAQPTFWSDLKKKPCPITFEGPSKGERGSVVHKATHQIVAKLLSEHTASG